MRYYVNQKAQSNGDHEVHSAKCSFMPSKKNRLYLGEFRSCRPAVRKARKRYARADGCYFCSNVCHTS